MHTPIFIGVDMVLRLRRLEIGVIEIATFLGKLAYFCNNFIIISIT